MLKKGRKLNKKKKNENAVTYSIFLSFKDVLLKFT